MAATAALSGSPTADVILTVPVNVFFTVNGTSCPMMAYSVIVMPAVAKAVTIRLL